MNELTQLPNIVTYGTLCGLAGDHVENPMLLETGLQTHFSKTNRTLALETQAMNEFLTGANSKELLDINLAYGILAIKDLSHFYAYGKGLNEHLKMIGPELIRRLQRPSEVNKVFDKLNQLPSMSKYFCIHIFAIYLAQEAGKEMCKGDTQTASNLMFYATMSRLSPSISYKTPSPPDTKWYVGASPPPPYPTIRACTISTIPSPYRPLT